MTTQPRRIGVAINPTASFGSTRAVGPMVLDALEQAGHRAVRLQEQTVGQLRSAVQTAIEAGLDALVVVGGDGMVSLAVEAVRDSGLPFGVVPSGTGNDIARGLGIPLGDPAAAIASLLRALEGEPRVIDAGTVTDGERTTWFVGAVSAGFDALVNERANRMRRPRGRSRYTIAILRELLALRSRRYELTVDGAPETVDAVLLAVANNTSIGGGMLIAPQADLADGRFDLFIVAPVSRFRFLRLFPKVFSGAHTDLDIVRLSRVRSVSIAADGVTAYADGERIGPPPVTIDVVPGALRVLA
ncbi:diacylglycerol/lipid kinase family protein [Plantibacter sp. CFBP 13570]|uniref:diacylglycerol/lipid kinase family protein n=1 Tax=Plantibacter sp. CFBP 13570 TaxID=2775272 RepID=UPI001930BFF7|nr:YegS/Rv2252/BmrU family lipid kinase [Plantibacter sp. CFBP 13570]MBD8535817.1 YegS/Rv2252/BmrU family lipid kinase [Plantibacter sp. CFBP 13570]